MAQKKYRYSQREDWRSTDKQPEKGRPEGITEVNDSRGMHVDASNLNWVLPFEYMPIHTHEQRPPSLVKL